MSKMMTGLFFLLISAVLTSGDSCDGRCDDHYDSDYSCQCNSACGNHGDCCSDYGEICLGQTLSCAGKCGANYNPNDACQCNDRCSEFGNCCSDYDSECGGSTGGSLSDVELKELSEMLAAADVDNAGGLFEMDLQCTTNNGNPNDCSPGPLFYYVDPSVHEMEVYKLLSKLYDNYQKSPSVVEDHTAQEQQEERDLVKHLANTAIMNITYEYLIIRGAFDGTKDDWEDFLYTTWFTMYDRAKATLGSSGFEHVFIGEIKNGGVGGFHSWYHWYLLEQSGNMNYLGYWETVTFGPNFQNGGGIDFTFTWDGVQKPYGGFFVGTSPELEMAVYTVCLMQRPDKKCPISLWGTNVWIQTWREYSGGNVLPGSSYPIFNL